MLQQRLARSLQVLKRQPQPLRTRARITTFTPFSAARSRVAPSSSHRIASQRWYSSATEQSEKKEEEIFSGSPGAQETKGCIDDAAAAEEDSVQKELEAKKQDVIEITDRFKRQVAEYRNLQEQTKREVAAARDFALQKFVKDLLDSVDNLDRALTNVPKEKLTPDNPDLVNLHDGLTMTEEILLKTLQKHGIERIDPKVEELFDPNLHEAVFQAPKPGVKDGMVFTTQQKGYLYNGRVLRAAKVGVVKNS